MKEPSKEVLDAFASLINAYEVDHTQMYRVLLNNVPVSFGKIRLWKTAGAAKTAVNSAIYGVMWHYDYWSSYSSNQGSRLTSVGITKEMIDEAFQTMSEYSYQNLAKLNNNEYSLTIINIKKLAKIILEKMIEADIIKIEKV